MAYDPPSSSQSFPSSSNPNGFNFGSLASKRLPTHLELFLWADKEENAPVCYIEDVMELRSVEKQGMLLWYLGRVPCRSVRIIGRVIAVSCKNNMNIIEVDDGTDTIECLQIFAIEKRKTKPGPDGIHYIAVPPPPMQSIALVTGVPKPWHDSRQLRITNLDIQWDANIEPRHWVNVAELHRDHYSLCDPFYIPSRPLLPPQSPPLTQSTRRPSTPPPSSAPLEPPSSVPSAGSTTSRYRPDETPSTRFRHPSRIRREDLTINTFRLHLKWYMDQVNRGTTQNQDPFMIETPGRPRQGPHGFTYSYLRRVPELKLLARRTVVAEHKKRHKEEIRKLRTEWETASAKSKQPVPRPEIPKLEPLDERSMSKKTKRILLFSLKKLWDDGNIVLWDGPQHSIPDSDAWPMTDDIWKPPDGSVTTLGPSQSSTLTTTTIPEEGEGEGDDSVMSEPGDSEEAFVSLTPEMLAEKVLQVMKNMKQASLRDRQKYAVPGVNPVNPLGKVEPPSEGEIAKWMARDEIWMCIGEIRVQEALHYLEQRELVYGVGGGRWDISRKGMQAVVVATTLH